MRNPSPISRWAWLLCAVACIWASCAWRLTGRDGEAWRTVIGSDGKGYYAYARSVILQGSLHPPVADASHLTAAGSGSVIKYSVGTVLLELPFILVAHVFAKLSGAPVDGLSKPYQVAVIVSGLFWFFFGMWQVRRTMLALEMRDGVVAFTMLLLCFGTGLGYYAVMAPSLSHVYSFAAIAFLLFALHRAWSADERRALIGVAVALGMVILIRPVNIIAVLALPLVMSTRIHSLRAWSASAGKRTVMIAIAILMSLVFVQPLLWYSQSGSWFTDPYAGEGFLWTHPHIWKTLFGAQKGLFFFWPLLLLSIPATIALWRHRRSDGIAFAVYACLVAYITSAWWSWEYGDCYGPRPYLDHFAVVAIAIGRLLNNVGPPIRLAIITCAAPLMALQCFQAWQFTAGIIHPFNMDMEKWRYVFLRSDDAARGSLGGDFEPPPFAPKGLDVVFDGSADTSGRDEHWPAVAWFANDQHGPLCRMDSVHHGGPAWRMSKDELPIGRSIFIEAWLTRTEAAPNSSRNAIIACSLGGPDSTRVWYSFRLNDLPSPPAAPFRRWRYAFRMPPALPGEELRWFITSVGNCSCGILPPRIRVSVVRQ